MCYILANQKVFTFIFSLLTKWLRGPALVRSLEIHCSTTKNVKMYHNTKNICLVGNVGSITTTD